MIESLENQDAVLLMYLAEELPAADHSQLSQRLVSDADLRTQLEELRSAFESTEVYLRQLDALSPPLAAQASAVRRVSRAMRQRLLDRAVGIAAPKSPARPLTRRGWAYPSAAAAAILVAALGWWMAFGRNSGRDSGRPQAHLVTPVRPTTSAEVSAPPDANLKMANEIERVFSNSNDADSDLLALRDDHPLRLLGGDVDEQ